MSKSDQKTLALVVSTNRNTTTYEANSTIKTNCDAAVPRFTGKTRITGKTAEIPERPKNNREIIGASAKTFIY